MRINKSFKNQLSEEQQKNFIQQHIANQIFKKADEGIISKEGSFLVEGEYIIRPDGNLYLGGFNLIKLEPKKK